MIVRKSSLAISAALLLSVPLCHALSAQDITPDTPVSDLITEARIQLASGRSSNALLFYDAAINRDPKNYLNIFQRGATYLSLGKDSQAHADFNKVLAIKPDFEGALLQRAKLGGRNADWASAKKDYAAAGKEDQPEYQGLLEAEAASRRAVAAETAGDWESCVANAGIAILTAGTYLPLRQLRARCRFERGEVQEGVSDLQHVLKLSPGSLEPHLQISSMLFYAIGDTDKGLAAIKKCLHSDPDSKPCKKLHRQEKNIEKQLKKLYDLKSKGQFNNAVKLLVDDGEDMGLITQVTVDRDEAIAGGIIHKNSPNDLYSSLVEIACECYYEVSSHNSGV